jgi:hypothetical protein
MLLNVLQSWDSPCSEIGFKCQSAAFEGSPGMELSWVSKAMWKCYWEFYRLGVKPKNCLKLGSFCLFPLEKSVSSRETKKD